ncbi:MAG: MMPL family transporter [Nocardioides sp.]
MQGYATALVKGRWWVVAVWAALVIGLQAGAVATGTDYKDVFSTPGTDSQSATDLMKEAFPAASGNVDQVAWRVGTGRADDTSTQAVVEPLLDEIATMPEVSSVSSPFDDGTQAARQVSDDGRIAYATIQFDKPAEQLDAEHVRDIVDAVSEVDDESGISAGVSGQGAARLATPEVGVWELVGIGFAALVLFFAFGSLVATSMPLVSAAGALGAGLAVVNLLSNWFDLPTAVPTIGLLLGLGVGIDYALFLVNRYRRALRSGTPVGEAVVEAVNTSGRAVIFAGTTVVISLLGLLLVGLDFLTGVGIGVAIVVSFTMFAAITLLPALLAILGTRVLSRRDRHDLAAGKLLATDQAHDNPTRWVQLVRKHPAVMTAIGTVGMVVLTIPVADLWLGVADQGSDPDESVTRVGYDLLAEGFGPGVNGPLLVVARTPDSETRQAFEDLRGRVADLKGVASASPVQKSTDGDASLIQVTPTTDPQSKATEDLIDTIRDQRTPALDVHVGGSTATFDDFAGLVADALPLFFSAVIGLSFVLLVLAFRSLLVPALGAVMNLLGAGAALGLLVAVFQWGWGADLLGVGREGPIEPFIPVMAFAVLFGLSMDYQVFLVSRIHEEWARTGDNRRAVVVGLTETRPVITAAAVIMVFVFGSFITGDSRTIKLIGFGLATGVLLDAFVLRQTVVPGSLLLGGRSNWYLPAWLGRILPDLSVEGPTTGIVEKHDAPAGSDPSAPRLRSMSERSGVPESDGGASAPHSRAADVVPGDAESGYATGYEAGQHARFAEGHRHGHAAGLRQRYEEGFRQGYEHAQADEHDERYRAGFEAGYAEALVADIRTENHGDAQKAPVDSAVPRPSGR